MLKSASLCFFVAATICTTALSSATAGAFGQATPATTPAATTAKWCEQSAGVSTYFGKVSTGSLVTSSVAGQCALPQFVAVAGQRPSAGALQFNLKGDYVYTAPASGSQLVDSILVDVFCYNNQGVSAPLCRQTFVAQVSAPLTLAPASAPVTTAAPPTVATCPVVYHFTAVTGSVLSASLKTAVGQPACPYGSWYEVGRLPNFGQINVVASGDFSYTAPAQQTWDDFGYTLYCFNDVLCRGSAYVLVSGTAAPETSTPAPAPGGNGNGNGNGGSGTPTTTTTTVGQTCVNTCVLDTWKATPDGGDAPSWDTAAGGNLRRNDGITVGTVRANYVNGSVVLVVFGKIGNLGQRFPTFEPVEFRSGETFSAANLLNRVARTSLAFNADCLARQPDYGMGEEVWHWTSLKNRTGELGPLHVGPQGSWYQKFGGAHAQCDTLRADSCKYAPLLTPNARQDPATGGVWTVDVDGCDVTWTGRFSLAAIRSMRTKDGAPVFTIADGSTVRTTLFLQAVQPASWLQPVMGYKSDLIAKPLVLRLDPDVRVRLGSNAKTLFTIDSAFSTFRDPAANNDFGFALDLRLYPHVAPGAASSYKAERHVSGFRWTSQAWTTPDRAGCRSCTGAESVCTSDPHAAADSFYTNDVTKSSCANPVVLLGKGPAMAAAECMQNLMYIIGRPGLSTPRGCATTFQNLTLRGVAPGSGQSQSFFGFEGRLELQLLLDTGISVPVTVDISRFVSMMSVDGTGVQGRTQLCRASEYWPVLDPLGTSLPISPFFLSQFAGGGSAETGGELSLAPAVDRYLCEARTRTFGPTTWATVLLDLDNTDKIVIESLSIELEAENFASDVIFFLYRDPVTGEPSKLLPQLSTGVRASDSAAAAAAAAAGASTTAAPTSSTSSSPNSKNAVWWHDSYPFFNFRDLSALLPLHVNGSKSGDVFRPAAHADITNGPIDYAVSLTPAAVGVTSAATLTWVTRIRNADGTLGGQLTLRTQLILDSLLSDRDVQGAYLHLVKPVVKDLAETTYIAIFATGGLIVGGIAVIVIFVSVDTSKPLPSWIPNMGTVRNLLPLLHDDEADKKAEEARKRANLHLVDGVNIVEMSAQ